jgi:hypothetical protein
LKFFLYTLVDDLENMDIHMSSHFLCQMRYGMASLGSGKEEYNKEKLHAKLWILIPLAIQLDL